MLFLQSFIKVNTKQIFKFNQAKHAHCQALPLRCESDVHPLPLDLLQHSWMPVSAGELNWRRNRGNILARC